MTSTETIASWKGDQELDTVEPIGEAGGVFQAIVGTYALLDGGNRIGGVHVINANISSAILESTAFVPLPAVLDSRVCGGSTGIALAVCADGSLRCLNLPNLEQLWTWSAGCMLLSLSVVEESSPAILIALSDSSGRVFLVKVTRKGCTPVYDASMHAAEAWTVDAHDDSMIYSGGDDAFLYATDVRAGTTAWKKRAHGDVGVTSVVSRGLHTLWTGGYDDCLKIWDTRNTKRPLTEKNLGGGVWRIKFHPNQPGVALVACMYDGFKIVGLADDASLQVLACHKGHESIAYGAAWIQETSPSTEERYLALTASFYDRSLQLWSAICP